VDLAAYQRGMLDLIVSGPAPAAGDDGYLHAVDGSTPLAVVREIGDSWRRFSLRRLCPLTWRLAEQRGRLDIHFARLGRRRGLSPFVVILGRQYLEELAAGDDALDRAVAQFELALHAGGDGTVVIDWPCDPEELLMRLVADEPIGQTRPGRYRTRAAAATPASFTIELLIDRS
jgi:hypothetical protein